MGEIPTIGCLALQAEERDALAWSAAVCASLSLLWVRVQEKVGHLWVSVSVSPTQLQPQDLTHSRHSVNILKHQSTVKF